MKVNRSLLALLGFVPALVLVPAAQAQRRPHIGYTYPAGGQQATTVQLKLGGQDLDDVNAVLVTGSGVTARVVEYYRRLNNQEIQLLNEQLRLLKRPGPASAGAATGKNAPTGSAHAASGPELIAQIERRTREWVQTPACASISSLVFVEVTIAPDAELGVRELRLATPRGVSNPLPFHVGQLTEYARTPMSSALLQVLGKEATALRKRPAADAEARVALPCTVNGQIASGEVNRYRFEASQGQRLVISTQGRQLIPYIADAVPGWFQPVIVLTDAKGREVAFADDYRFKPDPVILYQVPQDGEYVLAIHDSIYRGREDFVYRITLGELPFVTSLFPLGGQVGATLPPDLAGWNIHDADLELVAPPPGPQPGLPALRASRLGYESNHLPFALDNLPNAIETEPNNSEATAQKLILPVVVNGRIGQPDDWDVFQFTGRANDQIVAEVQARRLDSPLDSVIKLTDATGRLLAFNDDRENLAAGVNPHHADSSFTARLPADGTYYVHLGDTARQGGGEYGYRLRLGAPQPDFELRVVPSSVSLPLNATAAVSIYAVRKDGFTGPIKLALDDPPAGVSATPVTLAANQTMTRLNLKGTAAAAKAPVTLSVIGSAKIGGQEIVRGAVPAEDRMQAFLWRHLVPANELQALVFDPRQQPPPKRVPPARPAPAVATQPMVAADVAAGTTGAAATTAAAATAKPKFTQQQITGRLRQLKLLYEEGLLTEDFYAAKVAECETSS